MIKTLDLRKENGQYEIDSQNLELVQVTTIQTTKSSNNLFVDQFRLDNSGLSWISFCLGVSGSYKAAIKKHGIT